ncbi:hypothetical protein TTHERM_000096738 (macronuclear) [Tetrahymena thermophila SB210]|uniref:Uncharacterized protein n=1 Tax=Tetrahymena thermophila (strain SB210) TaxID=312017 RepID=W7X7N4_TETTS|nr:hypothetical protein TTHERM_000096738 [Tetrahymena thermophila SB210]EWS75375.1 hypothetical protein TTHERM_000096738 [Tetrahymena thermophila SB210]|eukprot:XP_012652049.1 hypothetical protein TTHERM_000096738 [Tetrahymena thermophila SB210]
MVMSNKINNVQDALLKIATFVINSNVVSNAKVDISYLTIHRFVLKIVELDIIYQIIMNVWRVIKLVSLAKVQQTQIAQLAKVIYISHLPAQNVHNAKTNNIQTIKIIVKVVSPFVRLVTAHQANNVQAVKISQLQAIYHLNVLLQINNIQNHYNIIFKMALSVLKYQVKI